MQQAFDKMRLLMAANALAAYPDHNKRFDVYTDASDFQLGACINLEEPTRLPSPHQINVSVSACVRYGCVCVLIL
jgi:hypothetical protein